MTGTINGDLIWRRLRTIATTDSPSSLPNPENPFPAPTQIANLCSAIADSPKALQNYHRFARLLSITSFTSTERYVLWLTVSIEHHERDCTLTCTDILRVQTDPIHSDIIEALWNGWALSDKRLERLRQFIQTLLRQGYLSAPDVEAFFSVGFTQSQAFEVVLMSSHVINVPMRRATQAHLRPQLAPHKE